MSLAAVRSRRWPGTVAALAAPAVLVTLALVHPGAAVSQVDLNDGAVWVTDARSSQLGRWSAPAGELNATLVSEQDGFDVRQDAEAVVLVEPARIAQVDPATVQTVRETAIDAGDQVSLAAGVVAVVQDDGDLWLRPVDELDLIDVTGEADVALGPGAVAVVSRTGAVLAATATGELHTLTAGERASDRVTGTLVGQEQAAGAVTAVGDTLVTMTGTTLHTPRAAVELAAWGPDLVLQQPGPGADTVLVAGRSALLEVPLDGGEVRVHRVDADGAPAAPVRVAGCAYAAWAASGQNYLQLCAGRPVAAEVTGLGTASTPVFRVNRDVLVLNDVAAGNLWVPGETPELVEPAWQEFLPEEDPDDGGEQEQDNSTQTVQAECTPDAPGPTAVDDDFGVRPGRTTILRVVDNDTTSDCGILAVSEVDPLPASFGTIVPIYGGRALQLVTAAGAAGTVAFTYTVTDERGDTNPSTAEVRLTVRSDAENSAPVQVHQSVLQVEAGARATYDVLSDFTDPDGDQLVLLSGVAPAGGTVRVRQDGELTFSADGPGLGRQVISVEVSDGRSVTVGTLTVEVRPAGSLAPVVDPVHAVGYVGQPVVVAPLKAVRSASREPLRLAGVEELPGTTVTTDLEAGTFTFTAGQRGTYYVPFVVTAAPQQATGVARIDIREQPEEPQPPTAVLDLALLPPGGEVVVDPLANDVDPAGGVLVLQSVDVPASSGLRVAILSHQFARVTSTQPLTESVSVGYTISNGTGTASGEIRVKPIEVDATEQAPVVRDLTATVRTGGVVTIPALDTAYDPDGDELTLDPALVEPLAAGQGLLFVSGDALRYQAPSTPMRVQAVFQVLDTAGNATAATVRIEVRASDPAAKSPPRPKDLTARVLESGVIRIPIPLTGIDPDGDGVLLLGLDQVPTKGRIVGQGADWLEYEALAGELGTDTFSYAVEDWVGQRATATIRVGIAPRPSSAAQVIARNDEVTVRPGQSVSVRVLANDVDTGGGDLALDQNLEKAADVVAAVDGRRIVVQAPATEGVLQVAYTATNARGGLDRAVLTVDVRADAPILAPVARDIVVPATDTINAVSVEVDVLEVADNPSGPLSDLAVSVHPSAAEVARVTTGGRVEVSLGDATRTVPYVLTNTAAEADGLSTIAFITVPAIGDFPPVRRPSAPELSVLAGAELTIRLDTQVQVAPGRTPRITSASGVSATRSDGGDLVVDDETLRFAAPRSYAGPASISFTVADGDPAAPDTRTAVLTLPITVLAIEDHPPTFTPSVIDLGPGDQVSVDLTAFTSAPVNDAGFSYRITEDPGPGVVASLTGSVLTLLASSQAERGTVGGIGLAIGYGGLGEKDARVDYRVVASRRPLARVLDWTRTDGVQGQAISISVLDGSFNPYPEPLTVVGADVLDVGSGTVEHTGQAVTVRPAADFLGTMQVAYVVADATTDPDRQVSGTIRVTVRGRPDAPTAPRIGEVGDQSVTLAWDAPAANGEPIIGYQVTASDGRTTDCPATTCTITGLTNDTEYTFTVTARNVVGESDPSPASGPARPDVRPGAPGAPDLTWGDGSVTATWAAPANTGSPITEYQVEVSPAPTSGAAVVRTTSTSVTIGDLVNGTGHQVRVRAVNDAPDPGDWSAWSATVVPAGVPGAPGAVTATKEPVGGGDQEIVVTWTASAPNGDPVARYDVRVDGEITEVAGDATSHRFPAELGRTYTIDVRASNKAGVSPWASTSGEIWTAPSAVRALQVSDAAEPGAAFRAGALAVTWTEPATWGGPEPDGYRVLLDGAQVARPSGTSVTLTGLTGGPHTVTVVAVNVKGAESAPVTASATTLTVPQRPTIGAPDLSGAPSVTFTWSPGSTGGSPILGYRYVLTGDLGSYATGTVGGTVLVATGAPGETLTLVVTAINSQGESRESDPVSALIPEPDDG